MRRPASLWLLQLDFLGRCYAVSDTCLSNPLPSPTASIEGSRIARRWHLDDHRKTNIHATEHHGDDDINILQLTSLLFQGNRESNQSNRSRQFTASFWMASLICCLAVMVSLWVVAAVFADEKSHIATGEALVTALQGYVAESLKITPSAVNIRILSSVSDLQPRSSALITHLGTGKPVGRVTFLIKSARVTAEVEAVKDVVVANHFLRRNQILGEDDLRVSSTRLAWPDARYLENPALGVGKRVTRAVASSLPLTEDALAEPYIIRHGSRITIQYLSGPLKILALGVAKDDGAVGGYIRVANLDSRKELWARIIDGETVQVGSHQ